MTTKILEIVHEDEKLPCLAEDTSLEEIIMDFSLPENIRIDSFMKYYESEKDEVFNLISRLSSMLIFSRSALILNFFINLCQQDQFSQPIKLEMIKVMLSCEEDEDPLDLEKNDAIRERNLQRKQISYNSLNLLCSDPRDLVTTLKIEAIYLLMDSSDFKDETKYYFNNFVTNNDLDVEYRFKTILKLEDACLEEIKLIIGKEFKNKEFVEEFYELNKTRVKSIFSNKKIKISDKKTWNQILFYSTYNDLYPIFITKYPKITKCPQITCNKLPFIFSGMLSLFLDKNTPLQFIILSGQYLLHKCDLELDIKIIVQDHLINLAEDVNNDYNRRADANDVLIRLGDEKYKEMAKKIIKMLGKLDSGKSNSIFDNSQNVHTEELETSALEILEHLNYLTTMKHNDEFIDYDYVYNQIMLIINEIIVSSELTEENIDKIHLALNRILIDRTLYSKFNVSLSNVLVKVWSYIQTRDNDIKLEMQNRLIEELIEMADTCFSGYILRLINSVTGFGELNLKISWEDQIISNLTGRLNAAARDIPNCKKFREDKMEEIVDLYLRNNEEDRLSTIEKLKNSSTKQNVKDSFTNQNIIYCFLEEDKETKLDNSINSFMNNVFIEMSLSEDNYSKKPHFSLFFRNVIAELREELYSEFKEHLSDADFDLYMRKALITYETGF
jgi:hypothetical protein